MNTSTSGGGAAAIDSHISKSSSTNDTTTATTTARKRKCTDNKGKTNVIEELGLGGVSRLCKSLVTGKMDDDSWIKLGQIIKQNDERPQEEEADDLSDDDGYDLSDLDAFAEKIRRKLERKMKPVIADGVSKLINIAKQFIHDNAMNLVNRIIKVHIEHVADSRRKKMRLLIDKSTIEQALIGQPTSPDDDFGCWVKGVQEDRLEEIRTELVRIKAEEYSLRIKFHDIYDQQKEEVCKLSLLGVDTPVEVTNIWNTYWGNEGE